MADEWFPDGIPPAIVEEAAANAAANSTVAEAPIVESLPTKGSESAVEKSEIPDEVASAENTAPAQASTEIEPGVSSAIASTVIDSELPSTNAPMEREESIATTAELTGASKLSPPDLSVEALSFARAVGKPTSPIFLAPAEPIPAEAFHSGEPQSFTWFIMLLVFAILLLPVFLLRSHWKQSNAALEKFRSCIKPEVSKSSRHTRHKHSRRLARPRPLHKTTWRAHLRQFLATSKTLAPDEELPKPLPDLNTPPPTSNPSSASRTPKPTLPAIIKRILKSPNAAAAKSGRATSAPTAPKSPPICNRRRSTEPAPTKKSVRLETNPKLRPSPNNPSIPPASNHPTSR